MRQQIRLLVLIALVFALAVAGYRLLFGDPPAHDLMVVSAEAATLRSTSSGRGEALSPGDVVGIADAIETATDGSAALQYGNGGQIMLGELTSMRVLDANSRGVRIEMDQGTVTARVRSGAPPLDVVSHGRTVGATDADFAVLVASSGDLSVYAARGTVSFDGTDGLTKIESGEALHASSDRGIRRGVVTDSLLLDVKPPETMVTRMAEVEVAGQTDPFAMVTVGSGRGAVRVRADEGGRFVVNVALAEGENMVPITVRDVAGREARSVQTVVRDSTAPVIKSAEVVWDR